MKLIIENCFKIDKKKKKFSSTKSNPPDQSSLKIKIIRCSFASLTVVSRLNRHHLPRNLWMEEKTRLLGTSLV